MLFSWKCRSGILFTESSVTPHWQCKGCWWCCLKCVSPRKDNMGIILCYVQNISFHLRYFLNRYIQMQGYNYSTTAVLITARGEELT